MYLKRLLGALLIATALLLPAAATATAANPFDHSVTLTTSLTGVPGGFGFARVAINLDSGQVCYQLSVAEIDPATAAHIHAGSLGQNGPVVVPFNTPVDGLSSGCVDVSRSISFAIAADPSAYYVNVHNASNPAGAVRGQLAYVGKQRPNIPTGPIVETLAEGLTSPRGIDVAADGSVYYFDNGSGDDPNRDDECIDGPEGPFCIGHTGRVLRYAGGASTEVSTGLPAALGDVVVDAAGDVYVIAGLGADPAMRAELGDLGAPYGQLLQAQADGFTAVADVAGFESTANPHPASVDSNPFGLTIVDDGFLVADAGGNDIIHVAADGSLSLFAVFPDQMVDAPPFLGLPEGAQMPMEPVPTSVVQGPDGAYYVGELTGFPFQVGAARVWRLDDTNGDGDALDDGEMTVYAAGFTNVLDVAFDSTGRLLVLEITKNGLLAAEDPENEDPNAYTGALLRVEADGSHTELLSDGLVMPTGMTVGPDGSIYISNFGVMPGMGQIIKVTLIGQ